MLQADENAEIFAKMEQELRRGLIALGVLSQLRKPQYGYSLRQALAERGMSVEEGTLYPLLRRLEGQGLLASEWHLEEGPPRRYYVLSKAGMQLARRLAVSWRGLADTMETLLDDKERRK